MPWTICGITVSASFLITIEQAGYRREIIQPQFLNSFQGKQALHNAALAIGNPGAIRPIILNAKWPRARRTGGKNRIHMSQSQNFVLANAMTGCNDVKTFAASLYLVSLIVETKVLQECNDDITDLRQSFAIAGTAVYINQPLP